MDKLQELPTLETLRAQRDAILEIAARHNASNLRVFGSIARRESTPASDIDLLVTLPDGASIFDLVGLWLDLKEFFGRDVHVLGDRTDADKPIMQNAQRDAVEL